MLAEHRSYRRAAEALGIGQPALTRSIQALEAAIGVALFDRNPRGVTPTRNGERIVAHAARVLVVADRMTDEIALLKNADLGEVRFGASPFAGMNVVPGIVGDVLRTYPKLRIKVTTGVGPLLERMLERGEIDFFVANGIDWGGPERNETTRLAPEPIGAFVRRTHPLVRGAALGMRSWLEYPIASVDLPARVEAKLARRFGLPEGSRIPFSVTSDSHFVLREVVLHNDAILLVPASIVGFELAAGSVVRLAASDWTDLTTQPSLMMPRGNALSDPARLVLELIKLHLDSDAPRAAG